MAEPLFLPCDAFAGEVIAVARDLIGRSLVVRHTEQLVSGVIIETEAYGGPDDLASHAAFRPGGRAAAMFGPAGTVYVYAAYGMYPCFNIVTGPEGTPSAVLVRGVWLDGEARPTSGPGRLTRAMGITSADHGSTACGDRFRVTVERRTLAIVTTPRIGITRGIDHPWRFVGTDLEGVNR